MTYRHIKYAMFSAAFAAITWTSSAAASCELQSTPLTNMGRCEEYVKLDRKFNDHYKRLLREINPEIKSALRETQRNWIRWREEKCDEIQGISGCNENGLCNGVAHDYCIFDLTRQRDQELQTLLSKAHSAKEIDLQYSKEYK